MPPPSHCEKEVAKCRPCQVFNVGQCGFQPMSTIVAKRPWDHIAMDLIGLLKCSERGFVFILIIIDVLTRFVVLKPLRTKEAKEIAYALVEVFANYGVPKMIQFDNEATFLSKIIEELRFVSGFEARNIMKYNPRQNGVVERFVAETKRVLMKWLHGDVSGWEYFIPAVQMGLNNQILSRHNSCPFSLMFGRRMNGFEEFRDWAHDKVYLEEETEELLKELKTWGKEIWKIVSKESEAIGTRPWVPSSLPTPLPDQFAVGPKPPLPIGPTEGKLYNLSPQSRFDILLASPFVAALPPLQPLCRKLVQPPPSPPFFQKFPFSPGNEKTLYPTVPQFLDLQQSRNMGSKAPEEFAL